MQNHPQVHLSRVSFAVLFALTVLSAKAAAAPIVDTDRDGLSDSAETTRGTSPTNPDTDGDGLTDGREVKAHGTDPLDADSDNGGVSDGTEVLVRHTDPKSAADDGSTASFGGGLLATFVDVNDVANIAGLTEAESAFATVTPNALHSYVSYVPLDYSDGTGDADGAFAGGTALQDVWSDDRDTWVCAFSGYVVIPPATSPGTHYTFAVGSVDGVRLRVFDGTSLLTAEVDGNRAFTTGPFLSVEFPAAGGVFPIELLSYGDVGAWGLELSSAPEGTVFSTSAYDILTAPNLVVANLVALQTVTDIDGGAMANDDVMEVLVRIRNDGQVPAESVVFDVNPPGGVTLTGSGLGFTSVPPGATVAGSELTLGRLPAGHTFHIVFRARLIATGEQRLQGIVTASTTTHPSVGANRAIEFTDDPFRGVVDNWNNPVGLFPTSGEDEDDYSLVGEGQVQINDNDEDGIDYDDELAAGTDPNNADSDGDGIDDGDEAAHGTNPIEPDTDGDGLDDGAEDLDGDGVLDPSETDPRDADTDNGGRNDGDERTNGTNPRDPADDGVHVDSDGDGLDDDVEVIAGTDPNDADSDDDGLEDGEEDVDHDGVVDPRETDPNDDDSDGDGLEDGVEVAIGTDPLDADTDGGGKPDDNEVSEGTDPLDPSDDVPPQPPSPVDPLPRVDDEPGLVDADGDGIPDDYELIGGGCAGSPTNPWSPMVVLMMLAVAPRLRRFRGWLLVVGLTLSAVSAQAQENRGFAAERMRMSIDRNGILDVEYGHIPEHLTWDLGLMVGVENDPLVLEVQNADGSRTRVGSLIGTRVAGNFVFAIALWDHLQLGIDLPVIYSQSRDSVQNATLTDLSSAGLGDLRLVPKIGLVGQETAGIDIAIIAGVTFPTGGSDAYRGADGVAFQPELLLSRRIDAFRIAMNLGYATRPNRESLDLSIGNELYGKLGMAVVLGPVAELGVSGSIATRASAPFENRNQTPAEVDAILSFFLPEDFILFAAAGAGVGNGFGTPDWRLLAGLRYAPTKEKPPEPQPEPPPPPPPVTDRDGDGILDDRDQCPDAPEVFNQFEDEDGCPDAPPPAPEPVAAPVIIDRDGDGVPDAIDNCPDVPGLPDFQGCPEAQKVRIESDRLVITETVRFRTGKSLIDKRSYTLLNNIAAVLKVHPEIELVEVGGHTDDVGPDEKNLVLSQKRSAAVVAYLTKQGVDGSRLAAMGYGESRPLEPGTSKEARAANRRVEFLIKQK